MSSQCLPALEGVFFSAGVLFFPKWWLIEKTRHDARPRGRQLRNNHWKTRASRPVGTLQFRFSSALRTSADWVVFHERALLWRSLHSRPCRCMLWIPFIGPLKIPGRLLVTQLDSIWDQVEAINAHPVLHSPYTFKSSKSGRCTPLPMHNHPNNALNCGQFKGSTDDYFWSNGCAEVWNDLWFYVCVSWIRVFGTDKYMSVHACLSPRPKVFTRLSRALYCLSSTCH